MPTKRKSNNGSNGHGSKGRAAVAIRRRKAPRIVSAEDNTVEMALRGDFNRPVEEAIRSQRAAGLPIVFLRGTKIIREYPDGKEEVIGRVPATKYKFPANVPIFGQK